MSSDNNQDFKQAPGAGFTSGDLSGSQQGPDKGYDQIPVTSSTGKKLVGILTLGNCLSYLSSGRIKIDSAVKDVMFNFSHLDEVKPLEKFPPMSEGEEAKRE